MLPEAAKTAEPEPLPLAATMAASTPSPVEHNEALAPPLSPAQTPLLPMTHEMAAPTSHLLSGVRRNPVVVGGAVAGAVLLVVVGVALTHRHKPATPQPTPPVAAVAPTQPPPMPPPAQEHTTRTAAEAPPAPPPSETPQKLRGRTLGGKKVVLEYDPKPTAPEPPPQQAPTPIGEDPAVVARAREAYHKGNLKLFAGDGDGAITMYREALKIYPGYVAGYRGLGLGFEEKGDTAKALEAFHIYVRTVPSAVDASLIRKRIERIEVHLRK
jgi:hypothetical protein